MNTASDKSRRWKRILFAALLIGAAAATLAWWLPRRAETTAPIFRTTTVSRGEIAQRITATGTLSPVNTVKVGSLVSGQIEKILVDYNDTVTEGQLVARIEPSTYNAAVAQAEAELASAEAALDLRRLEAKRSAELLAKNLVSQSDHDAAAVALRQQEATTQIRKASLENARVNLARTQIYAPIDGTVISRSVSVGQTVQANFSAPELFEIAQDLRQMEISAAVSEADIGNVEAGQSASFTVDAFPTRTFGGSVRQVRNNPTTSQNVVTYATIISVDNEGLKLRPGMTATVTITTARRDNALRIANAALRFTPPEGVLVEKEADVPSAKASTSPAAPGETPAEGGPPPPGAFVGGGPPLTIVTGGSATGPGIMRRRRAPAQNAPAQDQTVYVLADDKDSAAVLHARAVRTGIADSTSTEIVSGLSEGDVVVTGTALVGATNTASANTQQTVNPFAPRPPGRR